MTKAKKISLYEINPRTFKDYSGNGIGDLRGVAQKFDYFDFLGVEGIVLQDVITDNKLKDKYVDFTKVNEELGTVNDIQLIVSHAKKYGKKVFLELNIGTISQNHKWFKNAVEDKTEEFEDVITLSNKKFDNEDFKSKYNEEAKAYFPIDEKTQEIPLNWTSNAIIDRFVDVIKFWNDLGINGFVFNNFEYVGDTDKKEIMSESTLKELRKFFIAIKEVNDGITVIGKSDLINFKDAENYVEGSTKVFDYIRLTKMSHLELIPKYGTDVVGHWWTRKLYTALKAFANNPANIVSFGSNLIGRFISRWGDEGQYNVESAKAFGMLQILHPASSSIHYADELGAKNIQLTHLDDFQDPTLEVRKRRLMEQKILEREFMDAQVLQNPINARSLMMWNSGKNGGFSVADKTVTPVSADYQEQNVEVQFSDENSVLHFYKELNRIVTTSAYAKTIKEGKFKISSILPCIIRYTYKFKDKEFIVIANIGKGTRPIMKPKAGKVILSSYGTKEYPELPTKLEPFEAIVISKATDEHIKETQIIKMKEQKEKIAQQAAIARAEEEKKAAEEKAEWEKQAAKERAKEKAARTREEKKIAEQQAAKEAQKEAERKEAEKAKAKEAAEREAARLEAEKQREKEAEERELEKTRVFEMKQEEKAKRQAEKEAQRAERLKEKELRRAERESEKVELQTEKAEIQEAKIEEAQRVEEIKETIEEVKIEEAKVEESVERAEAATDSIGEIKEVIAEQKSAEHEAQISNDEITTLTEEEIAPTTQIDIEDIEDIEDFLNKTK